MSERCAACEEKNDRQGYLCTVCEGRSYRGCQVVENMKCPHCRGTGGDAYESWHVVGEPGPCYHCGGCGKDVDKLREMRRKDHKK